MKRYLLLMTLFGLSVSGFAQNGKAKRSDGTECAALPCVVATVSLTDQASPIGPIALITPTTSGLYQATYYLESSHIKGSVWGIGFSWTDGLKSHDTGVYWAVAGNSSTYSFNFRSIAGQPITYKITQGQGNPGGNTYNIFISIVQIQ